MSGTIDKLVRMANQIATELEHQQGANAATATWDHLWHFWDPRMCAQIIAYLDQGGDGLNDMARKAVTMLRDKGTTPSQTPATDFAVGADGVPPSDAG
ncbi:formate dehydrogenase subunit delta [Sphingomonas alpina]|uniref:Formate dehydrogenase subunit delta n=1 Tax=Sphingomonas alpina TaxID=653931 RepID=A0A7H0LFY9_9SPHN|nr:formate dehydrogenase subunit delta [Sphingomonas alpina]QNQ08592.1 formate dehydrogenase subunit delta [Sphingomonas alpina]